MRRRLVVALLVALAVAVLAPKPGLGAIWRVYGPSMEPTITDGSIVVVDHLGPDRDGYRRGDIVILSPPGWTEGFPFHTMVKRVVAVPGERVRVAGGTVEVNGQALDEPYLRSSGSSPEQAGPNVEAVVPAGEVFVMGDHRGISLDSTTFGSVGVEQLHGRVLLILSSDGIVTPPASPLPGTVLAGG